MANHLGRLSKAYGRETGAQGAVLRLLAELESTSAERLFDEGLHEFLTRFIGEIAMVAALVHEGYLSGDVR